MIHSGSRGLGYQVCDDHLRIMLGAARRYGIDLPGPAAVLRTGAIARKAAPTSRAMAAPPTSRAPTAR